MLEDSGYKFSEEYEVYYLVGAGFVVVVVVVVIVVVVVLHGSF